MTVLLWDFRFHSFTLNCKYCADMAELVDALDLGSSAARRGGSSPFTRTILKILKNYLVSYECRSIKKRRD